MRVIFECGFLGCYTEASRQKVAEVEETHLAAEGMVIELRGSLGLLETVKDPARSELHGT
jgi:hypothetical protein